MPAWQQPSQPLQVGKGKTGLGSPIGPWLGAAHTHSHFRPHKLHAVACYRRQFVDAGGSSLCIPAATAARGVKIRFLWLCFCVSLFRNIVGWHGRLDVQANIEGKGRAGLFRASRLGLLSVPAFPPSCQGSRRHFVSGLSRVRDRWCSRQAPRRPRCATLRCMGWQELARRLVTARLGVLFPAHSR